MKIAELYLEDEDPVAADTFCSRAAMVMHEARQAGAFHSFSMGFFHLSTVILSR